MKYLKLPCARCPCIFVLQTKENRLSRMITHHIDYEMCDPDLIEGAYLYSVFYKPRLL